MACLDCLRGSIYNRDAVTTVMECSHCHDVRPCLPGESIGLFIPYIPLIWVDIFGTEPINNKNQCATCKDKSVLLASCYTCHEKKCWHLMKPSSPHCLACIAQAS